jgi:hypothetical protein
VLCDEDGCCKLAIGKRRKKGCAQESMLRSGVTKAAKLRNPIAPSVTFVASARTTQQHPMASATLPLSSEPWARLDLDFDRAVDIDRTAGGTAMDMIPAWYLDSPIMRSCRWLLPAYSESPSAICQFPVIHDQYITLDLCPDNITPHILSSTTRRSC